MFKNIVAVFLSVAISHSIFWCVIISHTIWAITLLISNEASTVTAVNSLGDLLGTKSRFIESFVYISASILCLFELYGKKIAVVKYLSEKLLLVALQQFLLVVSAYGSYKSIIKGQYADGTIAPKLHILADQHIYILICAVHFFAIISVNGSLKSKT